MAVTAAPYAAFLLGLPKGNYALHTGATTIALTGSSYVPSMATHAYLSDVTDLIAAATPKALAGVAFTYDQTTFTVTGTANPVTWNGADYTARWAVLYLNTGTASTSRLIGYIDFGSERALDDEDFTLNFTNGFIQIPAA